MTIKNDPKHCPHTYSGQTLLQRKAVFLAFVWTSRAGLPDLSWFVIPKPEKMYQMNTKCSQESVKYYNRMKWNISIFSKLRHSEIYPNWNFWLENKPSGNPAQGPENATTCLTPFLFTIMKICAHTYSPPSTQPPLIGSLSSFSIEISTNLERKLAWSLP
jgi:hypothetical protein